ncbi:MAG: hypothetical protein K5769_06055 [Pseudobutyrivibrio sp.]|nr:hypothetical protein [Pseudobutyrivibrio sp.]
MNKSMAERAYDTQGGQSNIYNRHDMFQNGVLKRQDNLTIYMAGWDEDWGNTGGMSGYFTDKATIESCIDEGVLDTNKLDEKIQTNMSNYRANEGIMQAHSDVSAYTVDFERLDELKKEKPDLYAALTKPDGKESNEIKVAFGEVRANCQFGEGGGHQYYIEPETFKLAMQSGVFKYNAKESYSIKNSKLKKAVRRDVPLAEYEKKLVKRKVLAKEYNYKMNKTLRKERETHKGLSLNDQKNKYQVDNIGDYIATPDESYGYARQKSKGKMSLLDWKNTIKNDSVRGNTKNNTTEVKNRVSDKNLIK